MVEDAAPSISAWTFVVVRKFVEHMPLLHQQDELADAGVSISRRTLCRLAQAVRTALQTPGRIDAQGRAPVGYDPGRRDAGQTAAEPT
jgi:hypothetical protein